MPLWRTICKTQASGAVQTFTVCHRTVNFQSFPNNDRPKSFFRRVIKVQYIMNASYNIAQKTDGQQHAHSTHTIHTARPTHLALQPSLTVAHLRLVYDYLGSRVETSVETSSKPVSVSVHLTPDFHEPCMVPACLCRPCLVSFHSCHRDEMLQDVTRGPYDSLCSASHQPERSLR